MNKRLILVMPGMDGHEVCRRLKADALTRDIPIIFLTAMSNEEHEARGFELGAVDYITKPFSPTIVEARVRTQLRLLEQTEIIQKESDLKDRFLQIASHDLKNPLSVILSASDLMAGYRVATPTPTL